MPIPNPLLSAGAVATIDRLQARMMTDVCTIQRLGSTRASGGALVEAYATVATLPCRVSASARMAVETLTGGRYGPEADYEVLVSRAADVRSTDRILVNDQTLNVVFAAVAASYGFLLKVLCKAAS